MAHDDDEPVPGTNGIDLGKLLRSDDSVTDGRLDAEDIVRRARNRRGAKIAGIASAWAVAAVVVIGGGAIGLGQLASGGVGDASSSAASGHVAPDVAPGPFDPGDPRCGAAAPVSATTADGLALSVAVTGALEPASTAVATVTMTNAGDHAVTGSVEQPRAALTRNGSVTWLSAVVPTVSPREILLGVGESVTFPLTIVADGCGPGHDNGAGHPPAAAGTYRLFATMVVHLASGDEVAVSTPTELRIP